MSAPYRLYYWPIIPGRGEFVRMVFEDAAVPYEDVGRMPESEGGGMKAVAAIMKGKGEGFPVYAPPILDHGTVRIFQTANICRYVAERHGLAPEGEGPRAQALSLMMTVMDVAAEAHDTHHPVAVSRYYEDQKDEAKEAATAFLTDRLPGWLAYFEAALQRSEGDYLMGRSVTYPDLGLWHLLEGLAFAFPNGFARAVADHPALQKLHEVIPRRPVLAGYLESDRRMAFNEHGVFRHYPELDEDG
jgi:glutathione S-transferase